MAKKNVSKEEKKMNQESNLLLRRSMTKKEWIAYQKKQRSVVAAGMSTATRTMGTVKDGTKKGKDGDGYFIGKSNKVDIRKLPAY